MKRMTRWFGGVVLCGLLLAGCGGGAPATVQPGDGQPAQPSGQDSGGDALPTLAPAANPTAEEDVEPTVEPTMPMYAFPTINVVGGSDDDDEDATEEAEDAAEEATEEADDGAAAFEATDGDAASLEAAWLGVEALEAGQSFVVTMDEATVEASLNEGIDAANADVFTGFDVSFADDEIGMSMSITLPGGLAADAEAVISLSVEDGEMVVQINSLEAGGIEVPEDLLGGLNDGLAGRFSGQFGAEPPVQSGDVEFTEVSAADGVLTISGVRQ